MKDHCHCRAPRPVGGYCAKCGLECVLYGNVSKVSHLCIEGWGCWLATLYLSDDFHQFEVHEEPYSLSDKVEEENARPKAIQWLESEALHRGCKLALLDRLGVIKQKAAVLLGDNTVNIHAKIKGDVEI